MASPGRPRHGAPLPASSPVRTPPSASITLTQTALATGLDLVGDNPLMATADAVVVLMSGPSSAGKTTTARALQQSRPELWLFVDVDLFNGMRPPDRRLTEQELARQLCGTHRAIAGMAACGQRLVIEHRIVKTEWLDDLRGVLGDVQLLVVKFECTLEALEERERGRGDRSVGAARKTFVEPPYPYDLLIDSLLADPQERARAVADLVERQTR